MAVRILALALLHFVWQGALIGALAATALRSAAVRSAQHRYVICLVALIACALAPLLTAGILDALAAPGGTPAQISALRRTAVPAEHTAEAPGAAWLGGARQAASVLAATAHAAARTSAAPPDRGGFDWILAGVVLWSLGALTVAIHYAIQWAGVERIRRSALPLTEPTDLARIAARVLSRWKAAAAVPVMISHSVASPIVIGLWRPLVIFPAATLAQVPAADFELILLHEIGHIVRRDAWVNTLQVGLEILLFYHPVIHWLSRRARLERECACDDFAVAESGSAYQYAQALTSLAFTQQRTAGLSLGAAGPDLLPRLRNLARECSESEADARSPALLFLLALLLAVFVMTTTPEGRGSNGPGRSARGGRTLKPQTALLPDSPGAAANVSHRVTAPTDVRDVQHHQLDAQSADEVEVGRPAAPATLPVSRIRANARHRGAAGVGLPDAASLNIRQTDTGAGAASLRAASAAASPSSGPDSPATGSGAGDSESPSTGGPPGAEPVNAERAGAAGTPGTTGSTAPTALYAPQPEYPLRARLDGVEGSVVFELRIGAEGRPVGLRILEATPLGVFEGAVRRTVMKWRYDTAARAAPVGEFSVAYRLSFTLAGISTTAATLCPNATASRTCAAE